MNPELYNYFGIFLIFAFTLIGLIIYEWKMHFRKIEVKENGANRKIII